jgi:hypothetical protein
LIAIVVALAGCGGGGSGNDIGLPAVEPPDTNGPTRVELVPTKIVYPVGERVVVEVAIENGRDVGSVPFHLMYNPDVLSFVSPAAEGPFMRSDGALTVFLAADSGGGGEIVVGLSRLGASEGASGSGTLATFEFDAIAGGDCEFAFSAHSVKDPQARDMPAGWSPATVRIQ